MNLVHRHLPESTRNDYQTLAGQARRVSICFNEGLRIWTIGRKARQSYFGALIRLSPNGYLLHSTTEQGNRSLQSFAIDRSHEDHEASLTILGRAREGQNYCPTNIHDSLFGSANFEGGGKGEGLILHASLAVSPLPKLTLPPQNEGRAEKREARPSNQPASIFSSFPFVAIQQVRT